MKKSYLFIFLGLLVISVSILCGHTFCLDNETIEFNYHGKIFEYSLFDNIKSSDVFDIDFEINKYFRFESKEKRQNLLNQMIKIGVDKQIAINYLFPNLDNTIDKIGKNIERKPKDATLDINENSEKVFRIIPEIIGIEIDKNKLYTNLVENYINNKHLVIKIPTIHISPQVSVKDFSSFTHLRSDFSTNISNSTADRKHNIRNALNTLNKTVIYPNEIFSFNKVIGKRTEQNGYRNAKIIVNNEYVEGIGGGVCQVSSTLYNSALLAGLEIIEANKHSKQVGYVKYGFDAMVNFGSSDLKFRNNTKQKITIITNYSTNRLRIRLFGEDMNGIKYQLTNEVYDIVEPIQEIILDEKQEHLDKVVYEDEFFVYKKPNLGMDIKTYRDKYINNQLVSHEFLRHDKYKVQNEILIYGTKQKESSLFDFAS